MEKEDNKLPRQIGALELQFIASILVIAAITWYVGIGKLIVLHLFYLPVVLAGFYLGRYRAGVLALLCVLVAAIVFLRDHNFFIGLSVLQNTFVYRCVASDG